MRKEPSHALENQVFVLSPERELLKPCYPAYARKLLREKKATVYSMKPFAIMLTETLDIEKPRQINIEIKGPEVTILGEFENGPACIYRAEKNTGFLRNFRFAEPSL